MNAEAGLVNAIIWLLGILVPFKLRKLCFSVCNLLFNNFEFGFFCHKIFDLPYMVFWMLEHLSKLRVAGKFDIEERH